MECTTWILAAKNGANSEDRSDVAARPESKGRRRTIARRSAMGLLSGLVAGSSSGRPGHRPRVIRNLAQGNFIAPLLFRPRLLSYLSG
jgi:hypothetical protein